MLLSRLDPISRTTVRFSSMRLLLFVVVAAVPATATPHPAYAFVETLRLMCGVGSFAAAALALICRLKPDSDHLNMWDEALIFLFLSLGLHLVGMFIR